MITAQTQNVNSKRRNFGFICKIKRHHYHLGAWRDHKQGQRKKGNQNCTNDNRALKLWGEVGKIAIPGKQYTKKGMGYNNAGVHVQT